MSDTPNPWTRRDEPSSSPTPENDIEMTRQRLPYDVSGYEPAPTPGWGPYGQPPAAPEPQNPEPATEPAPEPQAPEQPAGPYGSSPYGAPASPYGSPASPYGAPADPFSAPAPAAAPAEPAQPYGSSPYGADPTTPFPAQPMSQPTPPPMQGSSPYGAQPFGGPQGSQPYGTANFPTPGQPAPQPNPQPYQPGAPQPYQPGYPSHPAAPYATPKPKPAGPNLLTALFDFSFKQYATPGLVKVVYILTVVGAGLLWLFWVVTGFTVPTSPFSRRPDPMLGMVALLFGWIPAALTIAYTRFLLEFYLATIRTATKVDELQAQVAKLSEAAEKPEADEASE